VVLGSILNDVGGVGEGYTWEEEPSLCPLTAYAILSPIAQLPRRSCEAFVVSLRPDQPCGTASLSLRDLGLGDDAPRAGRGLLGTEGTRGTSQESLRPIGAIVGAGLLLIGRAAGLG